MKYATRNHLFYFFSFSLNTGDAFMLVYTIDNKETFQEVLRIRQQIIDTKRAKGIKSTPMVLAGNKVDRDDFREIDFDDARRAVSSAKRCSCLEVSAKDNINIDCLFHSLFEHARLPSEMTPSLHRKVGGGENTGPPDLSPKSNPRGITLRKRISDACGVISPNARRPSLRSDLLQVRNNALRSVKRGDMDEEEEPAAEGTGFRKKRGCIIQ
nr:dexamethasone-induced Ras-related protein 1-like [Lytechinus pictus]